MSETLTHLFLLIGSAFFAGLVDAIAGGGGLISLPSLLMLGLPPHVALGTNKMIGIGTALASSSRYRWSALISWRALAPIALAALLASTFGAFLATQIEAKILSPIILILLVFAGSLILFKRNLGLEENHNTSGKVWILFVIPLIGFYDGFFGPGTGTFLMMAFVLLAGNAYLQASAQSRAVNFATNLGALLWFAPHGDVRFAWVWPGTVAAFAGGLVGAHFAVQKGARLIRPVLVVVTWVLIAKLAWSLKN